MKVRIPVSVNGKGEWLADGFWSRDRKTAIRDCEEAAAECGVGPVVTHIVYALVPVPRGLIIDGEVE